MLATNLKHESFDIEKKAARVNSHVLTSLRDAEKAIKADQKAVRSV